MHAVRSTRRGGDNVVVEDVVCQGAVLEVVCGHHVQRRAEDDVPAVVAPGRWHLVRCTSHGADNVVVVDVVCQEAVLDVACGHHVQKLAEDEAPRSCRRRGVPWKRSGSGVWPSCPETCRSSCARQAKTTKLWKAWGVCGQFWLRCVAVMSDSELQRV